MKRIKPHIHKIIEYRPYIPIGVLYDLQAALVNMIHYLLVIWLDRS